MCVLKTESSRWIRIKLAECEKVKEREKKVKEEKIEGKKIQHRIWQRLGQTYTDFINTVSNIYAQRVMSSQVGNMQLVHRPLNIIINQ